MQCVDYQRWICYPVLAAWPADHMEYVELFNIKANSCPVCNIAPENLGWSLKELKAGSAKNLRPRDYRAYVKDQLKINDYSLTPRIRMVATRALDDQGVRSVTSVFCQLPAVQPHLLHTLMGWIHGFLKKYQWLDYFDDTWKNLSPYPNILMPNKPYRQVSQWMGKEMRSFGRIILPVLVASLTFSLSLGRPLTAKAKAENENRDKIFNSILQCTRSLVDFYLMSQYKSHTPQTLGRMQAYFAEFHETKAVFLEFRGLKSVAIASKLAVQQL